MAGERFCVRNSGVKAVVEGTGDHACEYMTGGRVIILGETGKNFGAGMSGGIAYVFDESETFKHQVNPEMIDLDPMEMEDFELVRTMLRNHFTYTASKRALDILNDWDSAQKHFVKVMPRDYKRVLEEKKKNQVSTVEI
jgi:glutamate synthase (NADPH/NADH) large chain